MGPPSSPPTNFLLKPRIVKHVTEQQRNTITENAKSPAGVTYFSLLESAYMAAIVHGRPRPRNTFTAFDPFTFPTAESALSEVFAAVILAKVSGKDVPNATIVIAVTESGRGNTHPSYVAASPTIAVIIPMNTKAMVKAGYPPPQFTGGTHANITFQVMVMKWKMQSVKVGTSSSKLSSPIVGPSKMADLN